MSVAQEIAFSRKHGRRSGVMLAIICVAVAAVVVLAVWDGVWPPRTTQTSHTSQPG